LFLIYLIRLFFCQCDIFQPIPDAPAEITIFLLFRVLSIKSFQVDV